MKKAIMIGAGNIGRGFIGEILVQAGYHVIFADVNMAVIEEINRAKQYIVHVLDAECKDVPIRNISGIDSGSPEMVKEIQSCNLITTAVGLTTLPEVASFIAKGIIARKEAGCTEPLNVIACENAVCASTQLKAAVMSYLNEEEIAYMNTYTGFPNCVVDRIVPPVRYKNLIDVAVESHFEWEVEKSAICGKLSEIPGMNLVDELMPYLERKLFILNGGHAICAYMGYRKGYKTIEEAISDPEIYNVVFNAMKESSHALIRRFAFDKEKHAAYIHKILSRFRNPYLADDVARVGREPIRKLSADDRLVKPMITALNYGSDVFYLNIGIAAALHFNNAADRQSREMQALIAQKGVKGALAQISNMEEGSEMVGRIAQAYKKI